MGKMRSVIFLFCKKAVSGSSIKMAWFMVYGFLILLLLQLAYLPDRKREYMTEEDAGSYASELSVEGRDEITNLDELVKDFKRNRRRGMLGWFKLKVRSCALKEDPFHECLIRDGSGSL